MNPSRHEEACYQIVLTEVRTYTLDITVPAGADPLTWKRSDWEDLLGDVGTQQLCTRQLGSVGIRRVFNLPWGASRRRS